MNQSGNQNQAAQNAVPSPQQPGGGPQMVGQGQGQPGLSPDQQQLMSQMNTLLVQGKACCDALKRMNFEKESVEIDNYLNRITKVKLNLKQEFAEEAMEHSLMSQSASTPSPGALL